MQGGSPENHKHAPPTLAAPRALPDKEENRKRKRAQCQLKQSRQSPTTTPAKGQGGPATKGTTNEETSHCNSGSRKTRPIHIKNAEPNRQPNSKRQSYREQENTRRPDTPTSAEG